MTDSAIPLEDAALGLSPEAQPVKEQRPARQSGYQKPIQSLAQPGQTLYLKLDNMEGRQFRKLKPILHMFPGQTKTVLFFADTKKRMGTTCLAAQLLLDELRELLGQDCVVLK